MFTGIVEEIGTIVGTRPGGFSIRASDVLDGLGLGDSISVNGACLTATELGPGSFSVDVVPETLRRTNLGSLSEGSRVNLERGVRAGGRLDGHIVQGHVDGTGRVESIREDGGAVMVSIAAGPSIAVKTTIMAPSTSRTRLMKALTLLSIDVQDASTHRGASSVVSRTSTTLIPSTPTAYWMLNVGIQSARSTNCIPETVESKPDQSATARPRVTSEVASAHQRAQVWPRTSRMAAMPRNGTAIRELIRWSERSEVT